VMHPIGLQAGGPTFVPHPLMLHVAEIDGTLKPAFQEYEDEFQLEPGTLDPEWWPCRVVSNDGRLRHLTRAERHTDFVLNLDETYRAMRVAIRAEPSAEAVSKPRLVLRALLRLRAAVVADGR
jgi:hypothetical protein